ncbi:MAG: chromate efflux transporter [Nitrospiraceae bacterium]|nr:chromate efflux transporter [Nitrospiraceae bacterium]MDA8088802.1 chromate efflux transporter [Nitrospiraceae bacterium]
MKPDRDAMEAPFQRPAITLPALLLQFLKIGSIGFGGGMAMIALMERDLILKRRIMETDEFLHGVGLGQVLGPFAVNAALFIGNRLYGSLGGLACAFAFMTPSVLIVILLSWLYFSFHAVAALQGAIGGLGPVVIALILSAAWSMGRKAVRSLPSVFLSAIALGLSLLKINAVYILIGAGLAGLIAGTRVLGKGQSRGSSQRDKNPKTPGAGSSTAAGLALPVSAGVAATGKSLASVAWVFLKAGLVFFGGGFVLVPVLQQRLEALGWLTPKEFIDGVAISNLTPGPISVLATFAGFHLHGVTGALAATLALFTPALILMTFLSQGYSRLREGPHVKDFLGGIAPAVVGMVISAAALLAPGTLQGADAWGLMAMALLLLVRFQWHPAFVLAIGSVLGAFGVVR